MSELYWYFMSVSLCRTLLSFASVKNVAQDRLRETASPRTHARTNSVVKFQQKFLAADHVQTAVGTKQTSLSLLNVRSAENALRKTRGAVGVPA